jgi:hypothetical protein
MAFSQVDVLINQEMIIEHCANLWCRWTSTELWRIVGDIANAANAKVNLEGHGQREGASVEF